MSRNERGPPQSSRSAAFILRAGDDARRWPAPPRRSQPRLKFVSCCRRLSGSSPCSARTSWCPACWSERDGNCRLRSRPCRCDAPRVFVSIPPSTPAMQLCALAASPTRLLPAPLRRRCTATWRWNGGQAVASYFLNGLDELSLEAYSPTVAGSVGLAASRSCLPPPSVVMALTLRHTGSARMRGQQVALIAPSRRCTSRLAR